MANRVGQIRDLAANRVPCDNWRHMSSLAPIRITILITTGTLILPSCQNSKCVARVGQPISVSLCAFTPYLLSLHEVTGSVRFLLPFVLTLSLLEYLMEFCKVTLTFESVDEIVWCHHSNESSLPVLTHGAIYFSKFHKMKFGNLVEICFWLNLALKGLNLIIIRRGNKTHRWIRTAFFVEIAAFGPSNVSKGCWSVTGVHLESFERPSIGISVSKHWKPFCKAYTGVPA